jgi:hypothetical protein
MKILHVEDNYTDTKLLCDSVVDAFGASVEITVCRSEGEFCMLLEADVEIGKYGLIVMDVYLPWTLPGQNVGPAPLEVDQQGIYRAGLRNCRRLAQRFSPGERPDVILLTVTESEDLAAAVKQIQDRHKIRLLHVRKDRITDVIDLIRLKLDC